MITKLAMVVLAGYPDEPKKEKKFSTLREIAPGLGAAATTAAGISIRSKKLRDAYNELYPGVVDKDTGARSINFDTIMKSHGNIFNKFKQLKNDNTRIGKLNYFIANQLLKNPIKRAKSSLDTYNNIKSDSGKSEYFKSMAPSYLKDSSEIYSIIKNPKLNALGYGMTKALPWYMTYKIAKILYGLGKKKFGFDNKIRSN
jgi:hypothetical protein